MSASSKKKLRKEQNAQLLTEKQLKEKKEAKKLKIQSVVFVVILAAVMVTALVVMGIKGVNSSGLIDKYTTALTVDDHKINSVELNYYYNDVISSTYNSWYNTYGDNTSTYLAMMGLDATKPLNEQAYDDESTWADYFLQSAIERAASDYVLCQKAEAAGFELDEDTLASVDSSISQIELYAQYYGYANTTDYLKSIYGFGSTLKSYRAYSERTALATAFYNDHSASLTYDDGDIREYEEDKYSNYSSFDFSYYYISYSDYLEGGTTDEDGSVTYTDDERVAARVAAKQSAEALAASESLDALNDAISALKENADEETPVTSTAVESALYSTISTLYNEWLASSERKSGDISYFASESTTEDASGNETTIVNGYYVVAYEGRNNNTMPLANVRHLLVQFEGGTTDSDGNTTYSDAEKATAKEEAEKLLQTWKSGEATEESFIELVKEHTDDTASSETGGLYEDITPEDGIYVQAFKDWATDELRMEGDAEIVETEYGYHIMYYVGDDELTYRDYLICSDIRTEDMSAWYESLMEPVTITNGNTSRIDLSTSMQ